MRPRRFLLGAVLGALVLAGCGGAGKHASSTTSDAAVTQAAATSPSTASTTTSTSTTSTSTASTSTATTPSTTSTRTATSTPAATPKQRAKHPAAVAVRATTHSTPSTTAPATTRTSPPKPQSPVACMVRAGLKHVGPAVQTGTWQGTDPASHHPIYVDGPYKSAAAARASVSTLLGINQAAAGGVWEVAADLRAPTGPAVHRIAACLGGSRYSF
jgi:hypothetical protein